jgi:hypothetical protein
MIPNMPHASRRWRGFDVSAAPERPSAAWWQWGLPWVSPVSGMHLDYELQQAPLTEDGDGTKEKVS